ncbi:hypothetical protein DFH06DRAFT_1415259 [Mycena polygramma]|nr:hypothetical protein DFH06DRAFT_1415259 [Mycena polygramma]
MSLVSLPVELVARILAGMSIVDLFNVTRTSSYPRAVCLADRQIWRLAVDSEMLPLPAGRTLDSIELPLLLCYAARAISIAKALQAPTINPHKTVELAGLYEFDAWRACLQEVPSLCQILPGCHSFLMGGYWLGLFDIRGRYAHKFNYSDHRAACWAWESPDNGDSISLVVVWGDEQRKESRLCAYTLQYDSDSAYSTAPKISLTSVAQIPYLPPPVEICMKNSVILLWNTPSYSSIEELLIFEMAKPKRVRVMISADALGFQLVHATLHPHLPIVVAVVAPVDRALRDLPLALEFIETELQPITSENSWETGLPQRRRVAELGTFPRPRRRARDRWNLRINEDEIILHQLIEKYSPTPNRIHVITRRISTNGALSGAVQSRFEDVDSDDTTPFGFTFRLARTGHSRRVSFLLRRSDNSWNLVQVGEHGVLVRPLAVPTKYLDSLGTIGVDEINGVLILATCAKTCVAYC